LVCFLLFLHLVSEFCGTQSENDPLLNDNELELTRERRLLAEAEARTNEAEARTNEAKARMPGEIQALVRALRELDFSQRQIEAFVKIFNENDDQITQGEVCKVKVKR